MQYKRDAEQGCYVAGAEHLSDKVRIRQVFMPDVLPATLVALFVAYSNCCILAPSAVGCRTTCRPKSTGRRRNIALFMCVGASSASSACGWRAGWLTGSVEGSASSRC